MSDLSTKNTKKSKASKYFHEKSFRPYLLAKELLTLRRFVTLRDTGEVYVYNPIKGIYVQKGETIAQQIADKLLGTSSRPSYIKEACELVKIGGYIDRASFKDSREIIALKNGLLHVSTGKLVGFSPDYFFLHIVPVAYDANADCPNIKKFISEVVSPQDALILQEMAGYCLLRAYPYHKAFMLLGHGRNGKTTLLRLVTRFLGQDNVSGVALQELSHRFFVAPLEGKLANICDDLSDNDVRLTGKFKKATGESTMQAEKKFQDPFTFSNYAKMIFSANKLPHSVDDTAAYFERWILVPFPHEFVDGQNADPNLFEKLTTDGELSGMLNWALEGLHRLMANGKFTDSATAADVRKRYGDMLDSAAAFVRDCTERDPSGKVPKKDLYNDYVKYCEDNSLIADDYQNFCKKILGFGVVESRPTKSGSRVQSFRGIKIK